MNNLYSLFLRAVLAFSIAVGAPAALAGPQYQVSIDTSTLSGSSGFLSLNFIGGGDLGQSVASVSNFRGNFVGTPLYDGDVVGDVSNGVTLSNSSFLSIFDQAVTFGGLFAFNVSFESGNELFGTVFSAALLNDARDGFLGADADLFTIDLVPGEPDAVAVLAPGLAQVAQVAEVPEPGEWLLLATGLLLIVATRRMQQRG
jgi:hypothetical protein